MSQIPLPPPDLPATAFDRQRRVARGPLAQVRHDLERYLAREPEARPLLIDDLSGQELPWPLELPEPASEGGLEDSSGAEPGAASVAASGSGSGSGSGAGAAAAPAPRAPGRPRLGVVAREVTLLPGQWAWLAGQPGGASAALRRLVDDAWREERRRELRRQASEVAYRCLGALGEGLGQVDEALLAIYAGDAARFDQATAGWPPDVRDYVRELGFPVLPAPGPAM